MVEQDLWIDDFVFPAKVPIVTDGIVNDRRIKFQSYLNWLLSEKYSTHYESVRHFLFVMDKDVLRVRCMLVLVCIDFSA